MSGVYRVAGLALVTASAWQLFPELTASLSYFTDTEASSVNTFTATAIDVAVAPGAASVTLPAGETVSFAPLTASFVNTRGGTYDVRASSTAGAACADIMLGAAFSTYTFDPVSPSTLWLSGFTAGGEWTLNVSGTQSLAPDETCVITLAFEAETGLFTDTAEVVLTVNTVPPPAAPPEGAGLSGGLGERMAAPALEGAGDEQPAGGPPGALASLQENDEDTGKNAAEDGAPVLSDDTQNDGAPEDGQGDGEANASLGETVPGTDTNEQAAPEVDGDAEL